VHEEALQLPSTPLYEYDYSVQIPEALKYEKAESINPPLQP